MEKTPAELMYDALQVFLLDRRLSAFLNTHDTKARDQAHAACAAYEESIILCSCECPCWGRTGEPRVIVRCDCGRKQTACVECLQTGRVTCCAVCAAEGKA